MKTKIAIHFIITLIFLLSSCKKTETYDRFPLAEKYNIDEKGLIKAFDSFKQVNGSLSLVISRNGIIIAEEYLNGSSSDSLHDVRSVTKSFTSLLVGLAIEKGFIDSVNDSISKYLQGIVTFSNAIKRKITIEQMLKMSFGHAWNGTSANSLYNSWVTSEDHLQFIIDLPIVNQPGTVFNYSDGASHLLSVIISEATGQNTIDFAKENLFNLIGITDFKWEKDDKGYPNGAAGLSISPNDMIKFGLLILNKGKFNNIQVVPEDWINSMISTKISTNNNIPYGPNYGYQIWIGELNSHKYVFAMGWGGQYIFIVPNQNLIVVATCKWRGIRSLVASENWNSILNIIHNQILPSVK